MTPFLIAAIAAAMPDFRAGAINYLFDVTITIQGTTGGDDGVTTGRTLSGSPLTILVDRMSFDLGRRLEDHSAGQDAVELMRTRKLTQRATCEMKLEKITANALSKLLGTAGVVVKVTGTATGGTVDLTYAIVENFRFEYNAPSTLSFDLASYGASWAITT